MEKYKDQICQDERITESFRRLHYHLINEIVNFCNMHHITVDSVALLVDGFKDSIDYGSWHPGTDSAFVIGKESNNNKPFLISM